MSRYNSNYIEHGSDPYEHDTPTIYGHTVQPDGSFEEKKMSGTIQGRVAQGAAIPEDVNILPARRVGDIERDHYASHITNMHAQGLLDAEEYEARRTFIMEKARTHEELAAVTQDLPPAPRTPRNIITRQPKQHPLLDTLGNPAVTAIALAGGIPAMIFAVSHLSFIIGLVFSVAMISLFIRGRTNA